MGVGSKPFDAIYFDSNVLIQAQWPQGSVDLRNLVAFCNHLDVAVLIPEAVKKEVAAHYRREYEKLQNRVREMDSYLERVYATERLIVPNVDTLTTSFHKMTAEWNKLWKVGDVPLTNRLSDLFEMAINHSAPFKEKGRGFQDATILLSVLDHAKTFSGEVAFVSQDPDFNESAVKALAKANGVGLLLFTSTRAAEEPLRKLLAAELAEIWKKQSEKAATGLEAVKNRIEEYLVNNLQISEARLVLTGYRVISLDKLRLNRIVHVETPSPIDKISPGVVQISADIEVEVTATVEKLPFSFEPRQLRVRQDAPEASLSPTDTLSTTHRMSALRKAFEAIDRKDWSMLVTVDFNATFNNGEFFNFEPVGLRTK